MSLLSHLFLSPPQYGKPPGQKVCCLREKTRHNSSCRGSIITFNTEITQVAEVEPGNVVLMSLSAIRKRSNIWSCLLPSHSSTLNYTPIPTRPYKLFDKAGKSEACYQPGMLWCTSCWRNADIWNVEILSKSAKQIWQMVNVINKRWQLNVCCKTLLNNLTKRVRQLVHKLVHPISQH